MDYKEKYEQALENMRKFRDALNNHEELDLWISRKDVVTDIEYYFPELKKSDGERIRGAIIHFISHTPTVPKGIINKEQMLAWLEKQCEQKSILNVPPREVILSIWDLGNEWKELTNGSISTEYGTQLDYIQKHWTESEYYLREKQGEKKSIWSEEDLFISKR